MTVKDLRKLLDGKHPDRIVIIAKDREGNDFSPLDAIENRRYKAITTWSGELDDTGARALILWPAN